MMQNTMKKKSKYHHLDPQSLSFKLFLIYDIFMVFIITFNLFCLGANLFLMSNIGAWFFQSIQLLDVLNFYRTHLHPWVVTTEAWFIIFLIAELIIRWGIAIVQRHHQRWFFFPFIHWYEVLAIIPHLRFLRLFRAGIIAYRLHEMGYKVVPTSLQKKGQFYYSVVMEELSDRIVINVLDGIKNELETSSSHKIIIHDLVEHHRTLFATALADILQDTLSTELQAQRHLIAQNVGSIVNQAIEDTPELTQLLRLIPLVGSRIEQQIQSIGQRLGENITQGLIDPFTPNTPQNKNNLNSGQNIYQHIAHKISTLELEDNPHLEKLVESAVFESLAAIRKQVQVKQWLIQMQQQDQVKE